MENLYFKQYTKDILDLSRSMVIKFSGVAKKINDELKVLGYEVDLNEPRTWKYYLNISGLHHESDKRMYIRSSDTLEIIEFTEANLKLHLATLREYYPGSYQYKALVREYPDQEQLIRGILYPVDIDFAINAEDGQILYYDKSLIEGNEDDLIFLIQDWINIFKFRWYNESYDLIDDFNLAVFIGNLYKTLPLTIMNLRLRNCNSNKAHSYYVKEYLASNDYLDDFFDYLDLRQRLWLYRNIHYIKRNAGKRAIFYELVENILTPKGIPIINYDLIQDSKNLLRDTKNSVKLLRNEINFSTDNELDVDDNFEDLEHIYAREDFLARDNPIVRPDAIIKTRDNVSSSANSILPTKVLDSEVIDRSNSNVRTLANFLLTQWAWLVSRNKYRAYTSITNPRSGEFMILQVKDVFILMIYCYAKYRGEELEWIPDFYMYEALRDPLPSFEELRHYAPRSHISDDVLVGYQKLFNPMTSYISTEQFHLDGRQAHRNYLLQWEAYSFQEHKDSRSFAENIIKRHYVNFKCKLTDTPMTYAEFFKDRGVDIRNLTSLELAQMATDCYIRATGSNLFREITISEIQAALLGLMSRLSSYPLQFLRNTETSNFHVIGSNCVRLGAIDYKQEGFYQGNFTNVNVQHVASKAGHDVPLRDSVIAPDISYDYDMSLCVKIDPTVNVKDLTGRVVTYGISLNNLNVQQATMKVTVKTNDEYLNHYED